MGQRMDRFFSETLDFKPFQSFFKFSHSEAILLEAKE